VDKNEVVMLIAKSGAVADMDRFDPSKSFKENDIDSLDVYTIFLAVEEKLGIKFSDEESSRIQSVDDILDALAKH
jgi:acyl carrier protein